MNGTLIKNFREKVFSLKEKISDKDFFSSAQCYAYLQNLAEAITKQYSCNIKLQLVWNDPEGPIAFATDRSELYLNVNNPFFNESDGRVNKLVILKGLILHECGHLLFTDFHLKKSAIKVLSNNRKLFPEPKCEEYKDWLADAMQFEESDMKEWIEIWKTLENAIEDGFIESMILKTVPGDGQCLYPLREMQKADFKSVKTYHNEGLDNPSILFNCILSLAKYGTVKMDPDDKDDEAIRELLKNYNLIQVATNTQKSYDRLKLVNTFFCKLYRYMNEEKKKQGAKKESNNPDQQEKQKNQSNNNSDSESNNDQSLSSSNSDDNSNVDQSNTEDSSTGDDSTGDEQGQTGSSGESTDGNSGQNSSNKNSAPSPQNLLNNAVNSSIQDDLDTNTGSVLNDNNIDQQDTHNNATNNQEKLLRMQENEQNSAQIPSPSDMREADSIETSIAETQVNEEVERELSEKLAEEAKKFDYTGFNRGVKTQLVRKNPTAKAEQIYHEDMKEIGFLSKKMVNEIRNKIKDQQQGGKINGLYQGRYLDQHSLSRFDCRCLCKNDLPEDIPDMAIGVLIDMSGSMNRDNKYIYARRTALLLYEFGRQLNIPVMIYAHDNSGSINYMYDLADFNSVDGKDRFRICDMTPGRFNRDGMALRFCSEKLANRREQNKFMFAISDGIPSAYDNRQDGNNDIKGVLMDYSKKNVKYIAVGLGSDQRQIEELYTQDLSSKVAAKFLQCENPEALPVAVVRTIKQLIKVK